MECYHVAKRLPIRRGKPEPQTAPVVSFVVCSLVLNFIVNGVYTINIPEIFQRFMVF